MAKHGFTIFDCDGHVAEPRDLWDRYIEPKYRERANATLSIYDFPTGSSGFMLEGRCVQKGVEAVTFAGKDPASFKGRYWEEGEPAAFDPKKRIKAMDSEGITMAVVYPSFGGVLGGVNDPTLAYEMAKAYNNWVTDFCKAANLKRIYGVAIVPLQDVGLAVTELRRAVKQLGFKAVMVRPNLYKGLSLEHPTFDPFWRECEALDVAVGYHPFPFPDVEGVNTMLGDLATLPGTKSMMGDMLAMPMDNMITMGRLMFGGVMDRFPKMRSAFLESNGSWAAMLVDRMDKRFKRGQTYRKQIKTAPSEIIARQCFIALDGDEKALPYVGKLIGEDVIIWASDFPHFDGHFPGAAAEAVEGSEALGKRAQQKFLGENAARLYKIKMPKG